MPGTALISSIPVAVVSCSIIESNASEIESVGPLSDAPIGGKAAIVPKPSVGVGWETSSSAAGGAAASKSPNAPKLSASSPFTLTLTSTSPSLFVADDSVLISVKSASTTSLPCVLLPAKSPKSSSSKTEMGSSSVFVADEADAGTLSKFPKSSLSISVDAPKPSLSPISSPIGCCGTGALSKFPKSLFAPVAC